MAVTPKIICITSHFTFHGRVRRDSERESSENMRLGAVGREIMKRTSVTQLNPITKTACFLQPQEVNG